MSAPVPISLTTAQNDLFDLKKKYYLPPLMYLTIFNNIKKPIEDGEADFNMKKDRAIADFKKTSLYSIYYEIFDEALDNYSDEITNANYQKIKDFDNKDKLEHIKTSITGENSNTPDDVDNDDIVKVYGIFKKMLEGDKM